MDIQIACDDDDVPSTSALRAWASAAARSGPADVELTVRVVDVAEGAQLNERYGGKPGATNVLSFPFDPPPGVSLPLIGDVVVCAPVVRREALERAVVPCAHWAHLVVHGVLHLLGHDHQHPGETTRMQAQESRILEGLGFEDPHRAERER